MNESPANPAEKTLKTRVLLCLEISSYALLAASIIALGALQVFAAQGENSAIASLASWSAALIQSGLLAVSLLVGFVGLLFLPFKKKLIVLGLMVFAAILTRGMF